MMQNQPAYPEEGELVVATVRDVKNFGAFVTLDEYEGREAFIHISEIATGWVKYIRDFIKEGQKVVCKVTEVDSSKGHVNLSLKQVNDHQRREKIQQWKNENKAKKLIDIVAERTGVKPSEFQATVGMKLIEEFGSLYAALEAAAADRNILKKRHFSGDWVPHFLDVASENIAPPSVQIEGIIEVSSTRPQGVEDIRTALREARSDGEESTVHIQYIGAPRYRIVVSAPDYKKAEEELKKNSDRVLKAIAKIGGTGKFTRT